MKSFMSTNLGNIVAGIMFFLGVLQLVSIFKQKHKKKNLPETYFYAYIQEDLEYLNPASRLTKVLLFDDYYHRNKLLQRRERKSYLRMPYRGPVCRPTLLLLNNWNGVHVGLFRRS